MDYLNIINNTNLIQKIIKDFKNQGRKFIVLETVLKYIQGRPQINFQGGDKAWGQIIPFYIIFKYLIFEFFFTSRYSTA